MKGIKKCSEQGNMNGSTLVLKNNHFRVEWDRWFGETGLLEKKKKRHVELLSNVKKLLEEIGKVLVFNVFVMCMHVSTCVYACRS